MIITFDGLRWPEVFGGMVEAILNDKTQTSDRGRRCFVAQTGKQNTSVEGAGAGQKMPL